MAVPPVYDWPVPPFPADTRAPGQRCASCILAGAALPCRHEGARSTLCLLYTGRCRPSLPTQGRPVMAVPVYDWPVPPFPADTRAPGQHCACILAGAALPCRHEGARSWLCLYTTGRCRPSPPTRGRPVNAVPVYDWPVPPFPADTRAPGQRCACILAGAALPCRHKGARSTLCLLYTGRCRPSLPTRGRPVNTVPVLLTGAALPCRHEGARSTLCLYTSRCRPSLPTRGRPVNAVPVYWPVPPFPADTRAPVQHCALYTGRCRPSLPTRGRPVNTVPVYWPVPPFPADTRAPGQHCACILAGAALPCRHKGARSWLCLYTGRCRPSLPTRGRPVNTVPVYWPVPPFPADTRAPGKHCACILAGAALPCRHKGARSWLCLYTGRCRPSLPTRGRPVNTVPVYWPVPPFPADTRAPGQHCACILAGAALPCRHKGARSWLCLYTGRCRPSLPTRGRPVNAVPVY